MFYLHIQASQDNTTQNQWRCFGLQHLQFLLKKAASKSRPCRGIKWAAAVCSIVFVPSNKFMMNTCKLRPTFTRANSTPPHTENPWTTRRGCPNTSVVSSKIQKNPLNHRGAQKSELWSTQAHARRLPALQVLCSVTFTTACLIHTATKAAFEEKLRADKKDARSVFPMCECKNMYRKR